MILIQVVTGLNYMTPQPKIKTYNNTQNRLSVQVTLNGLSFLVTNSITKDAVFFLEKKEESLQSPEELLEILDYHLSSIEELKGDFEEVILLYATHLYTLVPLSLFDPSRASEYLKFNTKILPGDFIATDEVTEADAIVVYVPFVNLNNYMFDRFGSFKYFHTSTLLLEHILKAEKHNQEAKVYINIQQSSFDMIIVKKGIIKLINRYQFNTPEDLVYYVLFCFEQLKLNPDSVETILMGSIDKNDDNYALLFTYIRNISFWQHPVLTRNLDKEAAHHCPILKIAL